MQTHHGWILLLAAAMLPLAGCEKKAIAKSEVPKAAAVSIAGADGIKTITLSDLATKRLGITFVEVAKAGEGLTIPYNALLYDPSGGEWAYASSATNVYARTALKVEKIDGEVVYLSKGPAAGTKLVTNGAAELYGIEYGVGK